jgi:hypothetical protein
MGATIGQDLEACVCSMVTSGRAKNAPGKDDVRLLVSSVALFFLKTKSQCELGGHGFSAFARNPYLPSPDADKNNTY